MNRLMAFGAAIVISAAAYPAWAGGGNTSAKAERQDLGVQASRTTISNRTDATDDFAGIENVGAETIGVDDTIHTSAAEVTLSATSPMARTQQVAAGVNGAKATSSRQAFKGLTGALTRFSGALSLNKDGQATTQDLLASGRALFDRAKQRTTAGLVDAAASIPMTPLSPRLQPALMMSSAGGGTVQIPTPTGGFGGGNGNNNNPGNHPMGGVMAMVALGALLVASLFHSIAAGLLFGLVGFVATGTPRLASLISQSKDKITPALFLRLAALAVFAVGLAAGALYSGFTLGALLTFAGTMAPYLNFLGAIAAVAGASLLMRHASRSGLNDLMQMVLALISFALMLSGIKGILSSGGITLGTDLIVIAAILSWVFTVPLIIVGSPTRWKWGSPFKRRAY